MDRFYAQPEYWLWSAAGLAFLMLVVVYGFGSPWYRSAVGLTLLPMKVFLLLMFAHVQAIYIFGPYPYADTVRAVALTGVAVMAWSQVIVWLRIQREARKHGGPLRRFTDHL